MSTVLSCVSSFFLCVCKVVADLSRFSQMCSANPSLGKLHDQVFKFARDLSEQLLPQTSAYSEIWLDKKLIVGEAVKDHEPLYGDYYLVRFSIRFVLAPVTDDSSRLQPRKFKIAIAVPPTNDVDVYCHDLGYIAILDENKQLLGFNVTIGGGMGVTQCVLTSFL